MMTTLTPRVTAAELQYYQSALHNDPLELMVSQGDTIYLGKTYDLSLVVGISGKLAWWKDWHQENFDCTPTKIIDIRSDRSAIYLNESGNWWYWDDYECGLSYYDYSLHETVTRNSPLQHDNKLAFTVIKPKTLPLMLNHVSMFSPIAGYSSAFGTGK
jgi:hypothetical protein